MANIGKLIEVDVRELWKHEQYDFSNWLARPANLEYLNEILGLTLIDVDKEVYVGIRPEGFVLEEDGPLECKLKGVEVMGRDITVVSFNSQCENTEIRSIISSEIAVKEGAETVCFALKPKKVHIFEKETEKRLYFEID